MQITAICPECGHEFMQDSMYLGVKRTCPECGEVFVFEVQEGEEDANDLTARDFGVERIGCSTCFRISSLNENYAEMEMVPCGICGAKIPIDFAKQYVKTLEKAEKECIRLFLEGHSHKEIPPALTDLGMGEESSVEFADLIQLRIPFKRYEYYLDSVNAPDVDTGTAKNCDICSVPLEFSEQEVPYMLHWEKVQYDDSGDFRKGLAAQATAEVVGVGLYSTEGAAKSEKYGLYYLCTSCRKSMTAWFFNKYKGTPKSEGFKLKKIVGFNEQ